MAKINFIYNFYLSFLLPFVIPVKTGIHGGKLQRESTFSWIPAFAGMTRAQADIYAIYSRNIIAALFCLVFFCPQASAATVTATGQDSTIMFRINHDLGYTVGYFGDFTATLELGDEPGQVTSTKMQVATASINTRNDLRDEGLRSAMFFDAAQFPQATFESAKVEGDEITGTMTIKGVSQPVTLKVQKDAPSGKLVLKGEFNRNDFGVTYNITRADKKKSIGDMVELIIELRV